MRRVVAGFLALCAGCARAPEFDPENRPWVAELGSAVDAEDRTAVDEVAKRIEERQRDGKFNDVEYMSLRVVVNAARRAEWREAKSRIGSLRAGQPAPGRL